MNQKVPSFTAREVAEHLIADAAKCVSFQQIWEHVTERDPDKSLSGAERLALSREADDLITQGVVAVTFPGLLAAEGKPIPIPTIRWRCPYCISAYSRQSAAADHIEQCPDKPETGRA